MLEYMITIVLPFIANYAYFFLFATLFWLIALVNIKSLEKNKTLRVIFRVLIVILFIRHLLDITLIFSLNISEFNPKISYFSIHLNKNLFTILKILIGMITLTGGLFLIFLGKKSSAIPYRKLKFFIIFLITYSIIEFIQLVGLDSNTIIYITQIMTISNLLPLIIGVKTAVVLNNKNKRFFRTFLFNSIFGLIVILTLGIIILSVLTKYIDISMTKEETFIKRQIEYIDTNNGNELTDFVTEINEVSNYKVTCTDNPKELIKNSELYLPKIIDLDDNKENYLVFGSPYKDIHKYIGILFRIFICAIVFFNFIFSIVCYLLKNDHK